MRRIIILLVLAGVAVVGGFYVHRAIVKYETAAKVEKARAFTAVANAWQVQKVETGQNGLTFKLAPLINKGVCRITGKEINVSFACAKPAKWAFWLAIDADHTHIERYRALREGDTLSFVVRRPHQEAGWTSFLKPIRF